MAGLRGGSNLVMGVALLIRCSCGLLPRLSDTQHIGDGMEGEVLVSMLLCKFAHPLHSICS